jgi:hypothetical protein
VSLKQCFSSHCARLRGVADSLEFNTVGEIVKLDHLVDQVRVCCVGPHAGFVLYIRRLFKGTRSRLGKVWRMCGLNVFVVQEDQYTKILTNKVAALMPDIVLTSKGASKIVRVRLHVFLCPYHFCTAFFALLCFYICVPWVVACCMTKALLSRLCVLARALLQDMLRERANIAVVANVKPHLLKRLEQLTGATILQSVNHLDKVPALTLWPVRAQRYVFTCPRPSAPSSSASFHPPSFLYRALLKLPSASVSGS